MTVLSMPNRAVARVATRRRFVVRPATDITRMTRYRGGTYSHTVDRICFTDGSWARTDLIRLNPNLSAYSLDFSGVAPHLPSRYQVGSWSAVPHLRTRGREAEVDWILRHSFPAYPIAELSQRLRAAGYPLGPANLSEHEAIAATQAAIWHFTNGLALDTQPLNEPVAVHEAPGPVITFEFDGQPQLGGYSVRTASETSIGVKLQKSANGVDWQDVSGSQLTIKPGRGRHRRTLGIGSTLSASSHGGGGRGYRYYRLVATDGATIGDVRFWLTGTRHYRNADRVVHLYNYLLAGAGSALQNCDELRLVDTHATAESELIGPFQVRIPLSLSAADGHTLVGADGSVIDDIVWPGTDFYVRPARGTTAMTMTATTSQNCSGRVLTGEAFAGASQRFTPVALIVPIDVAIEFDITWQADEPCTDIA
ncbi:MULTISPECIES: thioester domain-containing protein [unclassified Mycobacterium]|uniref:thioester domain-containing protein n=1 Tax=unclassified Mycobacterium TaxID=2642494 RepID=UPI0008023106|nr:MULTISPECIES: thioester domain-containing protein [unclassified Mycobacterium]OBH04571.1 TQXA domain-containing protein [Mycobacterium sp. E2699]OBI54173.1 TQXA domain-containing protein [Mycobacterium sp. E787]